MPTWSKRPVSTSGPSAAWCRGANNPHARTLHKFAHGLGISIDELFQAVSTRTRQAFDRATNPVVQSVVEANADLFSAWSPADFDELFSQFGHGGPLSEAGVVTAAEAINAKRALLTKAAVILESSEAELLADFVKLLYRRVTVSGSGFGGCVADVEARADNTPTAAG